MHCFCSFQHNMRSFSFIFNSSFLHLAHCIFSIHSLFQTLRLPFLPSRFRLSRYFVFSDEISQWAHMKDICLMNIDEELFFCLDAWMHLFLIYQNGLKTSFISQQNLNSFKWTIDRCIGLFGTALYAKWHSHTTTAENWAMPFHAISEVNRSFYNEIESETLRVKSMCKSNTMNGSYERAKNIKWICCYFSQNLKTRQYIHRLYTWYYFTQNLWNGARNKHFRWGHWNGWSYQHEMEKNVEFAFQSEKKNLRKREEERETAKKSK